MTPIDKAQDVQLAVLSERMDQQMKTLFTQLAQIQQSQADTKTSLIKMEGRMENVESALSKAQPTLDDYITVKHKIVGIGRAGTILWSVLVAVVGTIAFFKDSIVRWITN